MSETIARSEWVRLCPCGERSTIAVEIGRPYETPEGAWRTPLAVRGLCGPLSDVVGDDSMQSLSLALDLVRRLLTSVLEKGDLLTLAGEEAEEDDADPSLEMSLALLGAYFPGK